MKAKSDKLVLILVLLCGIVVGSFLGDLLAGVKYFEWLSYGKTFGISTQQPFVLDLSVLTLSFGLMFRINLASILGMVLAFLIYKWVRR